MKLFLCAIAAATLGLLTWTVGLFSSYYFVLLPLHRMDNIVSIVETAKDRAQKLNPYLDGPVSIEQISDFITKDGRLVASENDIVGGVTNQALHLGMFSSVGSTEVAYFDPVTSVWRTTTPYNYMMVIGLILVVASAPFIGAFWPIGRRTLYSPQ